MKLNITSGKNRIVALVAAGLFPFSAAHAQLAASTYDFEAESGTFTEIVGGTLVSILQNDDGLSVALPIGFTFNYCGTDYTELQASSNGWASFGSNLTSSQYGGYYSNVSTALDDLKPVLMALWDDMQGSSTGTVTPEPSYNTTGTAPNRVFTLQYKDWRWNLSATSAIISFQIKLYESSNIVEFIYRQESGSVNSGSATIGIGDNEASPGYLVLDNSTTSPTVSGTTFTTTISSKPATGQIYRFTPVPAFNMQADSIIVATTPFCGNASQAVSLQVSNLGTAAIDALQVYWEVDGVAQLPVTYSGPAITNFITEPNNTATIPLGDVFFPDLNEKQIRAWTYQPNGMDDADFNNDTAAALIHPDFPGVDVSISPGDTVICAGSSLMLDAGSFADNPIYVWDFGAISQIVNITGPGTYSVWVQDQNGCQDWDTVVITELPQPAASELGVVNNSGNNFTFSIIGEQNIDSYIWDFGDGSMDTGAGPKDHTYTQPGLYAATATVGNECNTIYLTKQIQIDPTGISNIAELQNAIRLYPNPAKDKLSISVDGDVALQQISLFNLLGQKVYFSKVSGSVVEINTAALPTGIYQIVMDTDKGQAVKKLEIRK